MYELPSSFRAIERDKQEGLVLLQKELSLLPRMNDFVKHIASIDGIIKGNIFNVSYVMRSARSMQRNILFMINEDRNIVVLIYNHRFNLFSIDYYSGDLNKCKEMIFLIERLIPA